MNCISDVKGFKTFSTIKLIDKGWSNDKKYYIKTTNEEHLLLRVSPIAEYERKKEEYKMMKSCYALEIPMSQPIDFGVCNNGESVYTLLSWCDGEDAQITLPKLTKEEQYILGRQSGKFLKKIHSLPPPTALKDWSLHFNRKTTMKIKKYLECGLTFHGDSKIIEYIEAHRYLLEDRPQCYQHGDYHVGNMIISPDKKLSIIDFNRFSFGDPWEEFNRIVWSATVSSHFATGQLFGYFGKNPPLKFFKLLAFYIASNTLSSIYWAIPFGQDEVDTMIKQTQNILSWFNNMENPIPSWYIENYL